MPSVRYEKENVLGRVTLARASEANRLTFEMMEELTRSPAPVRARNATSCF